MKLSITYSFHYIIFLGLVLLLAPNTIVRLYSKNKEVKMENSKQISVINANTEELLHGEIIFRY